MLLAPGRYFHIFPLFFLLVGEGRFLSPGLFDVESSHPLSPSRQPWLGCGPVSLAQGDAADDAILRAVTAQQVHWLRSGKRDSKLKQRRQQFAKVSESVVVGGGSCFQGGTIGWEVQKEGWMGLSERRGFASWEGSVLAARRLHVWPVEENADYRGV